MITLSVSQINEYIKSFIDSVPAFSEICVKGEISNFTNHYKSGHYYFTLKDKDSVLKAVMFRTYAEYVHFEPQNGMSVTARGRISVYPRDGIYQLYCEELIPDGIGDLYLAYEQLKDKLEKEGLFSDERKLPVPRYPKTIGIVTSPTGAAIQDMLNIISRRYPICNLQLYPVLVQGFGAPKELISGIKYFDGKVDTIIIGRGGGSFEDLWAFNDEMLARTISKCKTPVISAVGHETDFTICDFVSDMRAPTPSAAAEIAVPDKSELFDLLSAYESALISSLNAKVSLAKQKLTATATNRVYSTPLNYTNELRIAIDRYSDRLSFAMSKTSEASSNKFEHCFSRFENVSTDILKTREEQLNSKASQLSALNPLSILSRGYAAVFDGAKVITSVGSVSTGDNLTLALSDGKISATVTQISKNKI